MRTFVFIRHGATDWNLEGRFQGQLDIPLNSEGRLQAQAVKDRLGSAAFDEIYTSPLRRASETARIIAGERVVQTDWRLAEIHHGEWQGLTKEEIASRWPDTWTAWNKDPLGTTTGSGESPDEVRRRVEEFLRTARGQAVLCVSHGIVIQTVRTILLGTQLEDRDRTPRNASVHTFHVQETGPARYSEEVI
jgi:broad specificity phosphatase PhoE